MEFTRDGVKHVFFPWSFRPWQLDVLKQLKRFNMIYAHRRAGKTVLVVLHMILSALNTKLRNARFLYITPQKLQAKTNIWDEYLKPMALHLPNVQISETDLEITFDPLDGLGARKILVRGADEGGISLKGSYLDGVVLDEIREHQIKTWSEVVRPMLSDREGWAILTGTAGQGYWCDMYFKEKANPNSHWGLFILLNDVTKALPEKELKHLEETMAPNDFAREYLCDFFAEDSGSVFSSTLIALEKEGKIVPTLEVVKNAPVITAWDLGTNDKTVVWFIQLVNGKYHIIDYLEVNKDNIDAKTGKIGETQAFDIRVFNHIMRMPYSYGVHILPHDSIHSHASSETTTFKKFEEMAKGAKVIVAPKLSIQQGIDAVNNILPNCVINNTTCYVGKNALHAYIPPYSTEYKRSNKWASDAADALRMFAVALPHLNTTYSGYTGGRKKIIVPNATRVTLDPL